MSYHNRPGLGEDTVSEDVIRMIMSIHDKQFVSPKCANPVEDLLSDLIVESCVNDQRGLVAEYQPLV